MIMTLTKTEKQYLKAFVEKELNHLKKDEKTLVVDLGLGLPFLKGEHEYRHFLEDLLKKLK